MTYRTPAGGRFALAYHTPGEWADRLAAALRALGCSDEYAEAAVAKYREAEPA